MMKSCSIAGRPTICRRKIGDPITVTFYEPESTHGQLREHEPPPRSSCGRSSSWKRPTASRRRAADPKLTPELPGVTDQESISDWDLPFELVEKIRPQDEDYWDEYRTTPKAFVSLATAKRLWPSRWGTISLLRIPDRRGRFSGRRVAANSTGATIRPGRRSA